MFEKTNKVLLKVFGSRNERLIKAYSVIARQGGEFEEQISKLDDEGLKAKTAEFKAALKGGTKPEDILAEAFAVVRETSDRYLGIRSVFKDEFKFDFSKLSDTGLKNFSRTKAEACRWCRHC